MNRRHVLRGAAAAGTAIIFPAYPGRAATCPAADPDKLVMGTASSGGIYDIYGSAWGKIVEASLHKKIECYNTEGANQNILLMHEAVPEVHLTMVTMGVARDAWFGLGSWTGRQRFQKMRALFPMYESSFHGVTIRSSGVERLVQLQDRIIGVGPRGGTSGTYFPEMMNTPGVPVSTIRYGDMKAMSWQLRKGLLDAFLFVSGVPTPKFLDLEKQSEVEFLDFSTPERDWLQAVYAETYNSEIPMSKYITQKNRCESLVCLTLLFASTRYLSNLFTTW